MIIEPGMGLPNSLKVPKELDFGQITIIVDGDMNRTVKGWHCVVTGRIADVVAWLGVYDGFWSGNGVPMMEKFEVMHFSKEVYEYFKPYATTGD